MFAVHVHDNNMLALNLSLCVIIRFVSVLFTCNEYKTCTLQIHCMVLLTGLLDLEFNHNLYVYMASIRCEIIIESINFPPHYGLLMKL